MYVWSIVTVALIAYLIISLAFPDLLNQSHFETVTFGIMAIFCLVGAMACLRISIDKSKKVAAKIDLLRDTIAKSKKATTKQEETSSP